MAKEYEFQTLVDSGKGEEVKRLAKSTLRVDVLDHACIREVLVVIFFSESHSWGRSSGHLFENKFPLPVLALAVALVSSCKYLTFGLTYSWGLLTDQGGPGGMVDGHSRKTNMGRSRRHGCIQPNIVLYFRS